MPNYKLICCAERVFILPWSFYQIPRQHKYAFHVITIERGNAAFIYPFWPFRHVCLLTLFILAQLNHRSNDFFLHSRRARIREHAHEYVRPRIITWIAQWRLLAASGCRTQYACTFRLICCARCPTLHVIFMHAQPTDKKIGRICTGGWFVLLLWPSSTTLSILIRCNRLTLFLTALTQSLL